MGQSYLNEDLIITICVSTFILIKVVIISICCIFCFKKSNKKQKETICQPALEIESPPQQSPITDATNPQFSLVALQPNNRVPLSPPQNVSPGNSFLSSDYDPQYQIVVPKSERMKQTNYVNVQINQNTK